MAPNRRDINAACLLVFVVCWGLLDVEAIPEEEYPVPGKAGVIEMIRQLYDINVIVNDEDIDGDTVVDAASVGVIIEAEPAIIVGIGS